MEEYYQKVIHLQERLRQSEDEKLQLEMRLHEILESMKLEEEAHYKKLRTKYKQFLEEDRRRQQRNDKILEALDRIDNRTLMWEERMEKFKTFRKKYQRYLKDSCSGHDPSSAGGNRTHLDFKFEDYLNKEDSDNGDDTIMDKYLQNTSSSKFKETIRKTDFPENKYSNLGNINSIYTKTILNKEKIDTEKEKTTKDLKNTFRQNLSNCNDERSNMYSYSKDEHPALQQLSTKGNGLPYQKLTDDQIKYTQLRKNENDGFTQPYQALTDNQVTCAEEKLQVNDSPRQVHNKLEEILKTHRDSNTSNTLIQPDQLNQNRIKPNIETGKHVKEDLAYPVLHQNLQRHNSKQDVNILQEQCNMNPKQENLVGNQTEYKNYSLETDLTTYNESQLSKLKSEIAPEQINVRETPRNSITDLNKYNNVPLKSENIAITSQEDLFVNQAQNLSHSGKSSRRSSICISDPPKRRTSQMLSQPEDNVIMETLTEQDILISENLNNVKKQGQEHMKELSPADDTNNKDEPSEIEKYSEQPKKSINENLVKTDESFPEYYSARQQQQDALNSQLLQQFDVNEQPLQYDESGQSYYVEDQAMQYYDGNGQSIVQYNENEQSIPQYNENGEAINQYHDENKQPVIQYDENGQPVPQYNKNGEATNQYYDESGQLVSQYYENEQLVSQYNKNGEAINQYHDENNQPVIRYDENGQPVPQYNKNGEATNQYYDESGQLVSQYDENGQLVPQYNENGGAINQYHDENNQPVIQYDENGQPVPQYNKNGEATNQYYDESGQLVSQYDENGQLVSQYNENGEAINQYYDENGQPVSQYDENGQLVPQYKEIGEAINPYYDESGQPIQYYQDPNQMYDENGQAIQQAYLGQEQYYEQQDGVDHQQHYKQNEENVCQVQQGVKQVQDEVYECKPQFYTDQKEGDEREKEKNLIPNQAKSSNVLEMLETDTESVQQDTKTSNDSDFDLSNA